LLDASIARVCAVLHDAARRWAVWWDGVEAIEVLARELGVALLAAG
jgi:hypothetical protein